MANYNSIVSLSSLSLISLLLFAAANLPAHGADMIIKGLTVGGRLCCTFDGNCPGEAVAGAPVHLECAVRRRNFRVGQDFTNGDGKFNITVHSSNVLNFNLPVIPCEVRVRLPLSLAVKCSTLSRSTGDLVSGLRPVGIGLTSSLGRVRNATVTGFIKYSRG